MLESPQTSGLQQDDAAPRPRAARHRLSMHRTAVGWWLSWAMIGSGALGSVSIRRVELAGGLAKAHRWMTLHVTLKNHGSVEMVGRLVAHGEAVEPGRYSRSISLPPGSRFRVQLHLRALRSGALEVAFQCGSEIAAYHQVSLALVPDDRRLVLVVDRETRRLPFLVPLNPDDSPRVKVAMGHVPPGAIPDHWIGYDAFDVVALHDVVASAMSSRQRDALLAWVRSGGTVVACVGRFAPQYRDEFFEQLLGVRITDSVDACALGEVRGVNGHLADLADLNAVVARAALTDTTGEPPGSTSLTAERRVESGRAVFVALDASAADEMMAASWQDWWHRLFTEHGTQFDWQSIEQNMPALLEEFSGYTTPSLHLVWLAMGGFFLAAAPFNYLLFRKLRRLEWAWPVMAALAVGFALVAHATGLSSRGLAAERSAITLLRTREHARVGRATTFVALFSPVPKDLEIGLDNGSAAVVAMDDPGADGLLQAGPGIWHVEQSTRMELRVPDVRPASFTWCRFEHLVSLPEPFAVECHALDEDGPRLLRGLEPWAPSQFAVVEGAQSFHATPMASGGSVLVGPLPVMRTGVYHQLCQGLITATMRDRAPHSQHRFLSHIRLFWLSPGLGSGSVVGCATKRTAIFSDGRPADPTVCWLVVDRASPGTQRDRGLPVQLRLQTSRFSRPFAGTQAEDLAVAGRVRIRFLSTGASSWLGQAQIPVGLQRKWWHRLRLKLRFTSDNRGSLHVAAAAFGRRRPLLWHPGLLTGDDGSRELTVEIPVSELPVALDRTLELGVKLDRRGTSLPLSKRDWVELSAFLDLRFPQ